MKKILSKCTVGDFEYLSETLDSFYSFTDDKGRKSLFENYKNNPNEENKLAIVEKIDSQIRYYASADFAYLYRKIIKGEGEVLADEMIEDVAKKLKVKIKLVGSTESKLERLVKAVVEKEFYNKSPEELAKAFKKLKLTPKQIEEILNEIKKIGKIAIIPILIRVVGKEAVVSIVETIVIAILAQVMGREAARLLVKEIGKRNPYINALGPIAWAVSAAWIAFDLQGPAYRKTIPTCLYLGVVGLRDGAEDGDSFWDDSSLE